MLLHTPNNPSSTSTAAAAPQQGRPAYSAKAELPKAHVPQPRPHTNPAPLYGCRLAACSNQPPLANKHIINLYTILPAAATGCSTAAHGIPLLPTHSTSTGQQDKAQQVQCAYNLHMPPCSPSHTGHAAEPQTAAEDAFHKDQFHLVNEKVPRNGWAGRYTVTALPA